MSNPRNEPSVRPVSIARTFLKRAVPSALERWWRRGFTGRAPPRRRTRPCTRSRRQARRHPALRRVHNAPGPLRRPQSGTVANIGLAEPMYDTLLRRSRKTARRYPGPRLKWRSRPTARGTRFI